MGRELAGEPIEQIVDPKIGGLRVMFPVSILLMSSSVLSMPAMPSSDTIARPSSFRVFSSLASESSMSCRKIRVCSGCRRSWLAAARKRDLARLACS
ncbi:MAG: hypothetical protein WA633_05755, partial [Stellaceae bacterium]